MLKKTPTLVGLSEKGKRIRDALACGQLIIDAFKLASVLLSKEPDLYAYMQENNYLRRDDPSQGDPSPEADQPPNPIRLEKR